MGEKQKKTPQDVKMEFNIGQQEKQIDSIYFEMYRQQSVATLLSQQSSVFIKSYGINGLASLNFRGSSAAQSTVLWNGVPILNPALGVADISLLQTGLFSHIAMNYGSSAAMMGSGNVGGALLLNNNANQFQNKTNTSLNIGIGSFGRYDAGIQSEWSNKHLQIRMNGFYQQASNKFTYFNEQEEKKQLPNAHLQAYGALGSIIYRIAGNDSSEYAESIAIHLWLQNYHRNIPPALFEIFSDKTQHDVSIRSLLHYNREQKNKNIYFKSSWSYESLNYTEAAIAMDSKNKVHQYYQEIGAKWLLPSQTGVFQHELLLFSPWVYSFVQKEKITDPQKKQWRPALATAYKIQYKSWKSQISIRQEWWNENVVPLLPGWGLEWKKNKISLGKTSQIQLKIQANVQKTYRVPTLNELYYTPGGNSNLLPETGWSQDLGYELEIEKHLINNSSKPLKLTHRLSIYNRNISNWIYWMGGAIWTPHNIAKVNSRGIESDNTLQIHYHKTRWIISLSSNYTLATSTASYIPNDNSFGKQIPYTPRYNIQTNIGWQWNNWFVNYNHSYVGYRFTTIDESQYLPPYHVGNIQAMYSFKIFGQRLSLALQCNNLWNVTYQVVRARPMPNRHFLLQFKWNVGSI